MKRNFKTKKGVIMIITLAFIMSLTLLVLRNATTTDKYLKDVGNSLFYAQFNRSFLDMTVAIKKLSKQIKDADTLAFALKIPIIISDKKSNMQAFLKLNHGAKKFNINKLIKNGKINQPLYDLIYSIMNNYDISDSPFFMSLLLDAIDADNKQRVYGSEFTHLEDTTLSDGGVMNYHGFKKILDYYAAFQNDGNIYKIPWSEIISFSGKKIDYNYLSPLVKASLEQNYGISEFNKNSLIYKDKDLSLTREQKDVLKTLDIDYYVPVILCNFEFHFEDKQAHVVFFYDLQSKRISGIETIF